MGWDWICPGHTHGLELVLLLSRLFFFLLLADCWLLAGWLVLRILTHPLQVSSHARPPPPLPPLVFLSVCLPPSRRHPPLSLSPLASSSVFFLLPTPSLSRPPSQFPLFTFLRTLVIPFFCCFVLSRPWIRWLTIQAEIFSRRLSTLSRSPGLASDAKPKSAPGHLTGPVCGSSRNSDPIIQSSPILACLALLPPSPT
ncbi:uncharacterized protein BO80DRAFT_269322 [Aspergillus ibericus CBS 121593]|uniref:Uncharacterized protein n=1 Tax=Aspergillus ibericus CBS 121593 TaxID=1448316 RepID=A0A395H9A7_9EURO|nr:hypothetical protein BO80DRAFT_269322 [Aspergillus ibericus CBS 121593]RAL03745.1 hypothetical protein BO80DRAFT_269322 [Aspergillus ibericus CBS 121593]